MKMFDRDGVISLPAEYTILAIVASLSIALIFASLHNLWKENETREAIKEVNKIVGMAEEMYVAGENGSAISMEVNMPSSVKKVIFGPPDCPKNCYRIIMKWGDSMTFHSISYFEYSVLYGGCREVKIEVIDGGDYVKIY